MQNKCSYALYYDPSYGTNFVGDNKLDDLGICVNTNNHSSSRSNLGVVYEVPPGQTNTFLAGFNILKLS